MTEFTGRPHNSIRLEEPEGPMVKSFVSSLFHQFMAGRLRAEMPAADEQLVARIVQQNVNSHPATQRLRSPFRNPFRLGGLAHDWRLEVPRVGTL